MTLWFATRRWWLSAVGLLVFLFAAIGAGEHQADLPSFTPIGSVTVKLMLFSPIPVCLAILYCLDRRLPTAELTGIRRTGLADQAVVMTVGGLALCIAVLVSSSGHAASAQAAGRNALFLMGLGMTVRAMLGSTAAGAASVGWLALVTLVGYGGNLRPYAWTVVLRGANDVVSGALACSMFAVGLALTGLRAPKTRGLN